MARVIGIFEAKTKFSEICSTVEESGVEYIVTRRGKEVARIVPSKATDPGSGKSFGTLPITKALAAWDLEHGPPPDDEPDFPDVWLERWGCKPSPFEDEDSEEDPSGKEA